MWTRIFLILKLFWSYTNIGQESAASPEVFISYQWGKQPEIKALYRKLTSLGLTCWLDIMQMGGGDSLYEKIDKGVRGCKVVLACVTAKYTLSANCRREVSLADAIKKPIIPLLLERITWPPEGPMAMVFTQLVYFNFSARDSLIKTQWQCSEFDELMGKIGTHVGTSLAAPDTTKNSETSAKPSTTSKQDVAETSSKQNSNNGAVSNPDPEKPTKQPEADANKTIQKADDVPSNTAVTSSDSTANKNDSVTQVPVVAPKSSCCTIM